MSHLTPVMQEFILHWGEMGSSWGINRTIAQIYALLYLSPTPLTAEEISSKLSLARSTVSTGLHELQSWGIVKTTHLLGDRRDYFEAIDDVWETFRAIARERKRREIDPTLELLRQSLTELEHCEEEPPYVQERLQELLYFFELLTTVYNQVDQLPTKALAKVAELGDKFAQVLDMLTKT